METRFQIFDTEDKELYVGVCSHYFKITDAKDIYRKSFIKDADTKDDSIIIEIAKKNAKEVEGIVAFGVDEGEQFALALLNLCNSIKR